MRIALVLTPLSDENLQLAAQVGATDVVARYPGLDYDELARLRDRVAGFGLRLSVVEGYIPMDRIKLGEPDRVPSSTTFKPLTPISRPRCMRSRMGGFS